MSKFKVNQLHKSYLQPHQQIPVLQGVDLELNSGESLAIVGSSGVGKSTLLHCLGLLDTIDSGEIYFDDRRLSSDSESLRAERRRDSIGFVFQFHYLMAELTSLENVMVPLLIHRKTMQEAEGLASEWLKRVGLGHRLKHRPGELSGGEQQRVAIARALVYAPKIILADEPTGNLDPETARQVFDVLLEQCQHLHSILIMATHNLELAKNLDKTSSLKQGKLI